MPDSGYWSLLAVTPQVPSPPLCCFWKILQSESVNRIRNIYSQVEKQSQVKLQGVPKNLISMSRTERNLKKAPEMDSSWVVLVKARSQTLLAKVMGLVLYMLCRKLNPDAICSFQTSTLVFFPGLCCIVHLITKSHKSSLK